MTTAELTLTDFLLARIAEDEESFAVDPNDPSPEEWFERGDLNESRLTWVNRRVLAECEAKRRIVKIHSPCGECVSGKEPCETALLLALPYADHADYREEWRP